MEAEYILLKIEFLRKNMHVQCDQVNNNLLDKTVIKASQLLDNALNEYSQYINTQPLI